MALLEEHTPLIKAMSFVAHYNSSGGGKTPAHHSCTGRKRDERTVMLMTEGKEEHLHNQSMYNVNPAKESKSSIKILTFIVIVYIFVNKEKPRTVEP